MALTPDGTKAFVADSTGADVAVIDTASNTVSNVILIPGVQPRGLAVTNNNGGHEPQLVYITQFLSQPTPNGGPGLDQGSEGKVFIIATVDLTKVQGVITLAAHDTGFAADRTVFGGTAIDPTFADTNQLQSVVLKDGRGYLPNIAASPERPIKFNVDTQANCQLCHGGAKWSASQVDFARVASEPPTGQLARFLRQVAPLTRRTRWSTLPPTRPPWANWASTRLRC